MKVALFFGSFNPIHVGHLIIANHIAENASFDQIWFVVSPHNPHKEKSTLLADYHRLAMVKIAIENNPKLRASDIEFNLEQPNYTVKTLTILKERYPNTSFSIIMGEDNINSFHKWYNYKHILANYSIIVYPRLFGKNPDSGQKFLQHPRVEFIKNVPIMQISSSFIRKQLKNKRSIKYLVTSEVFNYIDEMNFYK